MLICFRPLFLHHNISPIRHKLPFVRNCESKFTRLSKKTLTNYDSDIPLRIAFSFDIFCKKTKQQTHIQLSFQKFFFITI